MVEREAYVRHVTITLRDFHYGVPVLSLVNGRRSMLVIALCEMLGLCMFSGRWTDDDATGETHISLHLHCRGGWFLSCMSNRDHVPSEKGNASRLSSYSPL